MMADVEDLSLPPSPPASDIDDTTIHADSRHDRPDTRPTQEHADATVCYKHVGVQTMSLPPSPPDDKDISPVLCHSRPSTPSSRTVTPTPRPLNPKAAAYSSLSFGRPVRRIVSAPDQSLDTDLFDSFSEMSLTTLDNSADSADAYVQDSLEDTITRFTRLSPGMRAVTMPSPDPAIIESFAQPRSVSDNLAALEHAAAARNDLRSYDIANMDQFDTTAPRSPSFTPTIGTSMLEDWSTMYHLESTGSRSTNWANHSMLLHPRHEQLRSPPRPIPALHGPSSLPYARCPSGAEGTILEGPTELQHIVWGLSTPANPTPAPQPSDLNGSNVKTVGLNGVDDTLPHLLQRTRQMSGATHTNMLERRAADLGPRRRTSSDPMTIPEWSASPTAINLNAYLLAARASAGYHPLDVVITHEDPLQQEFYEARQRLDSEIALLQLQQYNHYHELLLPQIQSLAKNSLYPAPPPQQRADQFAQYGGHPQQPLPSRYAPLSPTDTGYRNARDTVVIPAVLPQTPAKRDRTLDVSAGMPQAYKTGALGQLRLGQRRPTAIDILSVPDIVTTPATPTTQDVHHSLLTFDPRLLVPIMTPATQPGISASTAQEVQTPAPRGAMRDSFKRVVDEQQAATSSSNGVARPQWTTPSPRARTSALSTASFPSNIPSGPRSIPIARLLQQHGDPSILPTPPMAATSGHSYPPSTTLGSPLQLQSSRVKPAPPVNFPSRVLPSWLTGSRLTDAEGADTGETRRDSNGPMDGLARETESEEEVVLFGQGQNGATTMLKESNGRLRTSHP